MKVVYDSTDSARSEKPGIEIDGLAKSVRANGTLTQASARWWREGGYPLRDLSTMKLLRVCVQVRTSMHCVVLPVGPPNHARTLGLAATPRIHHCNARNSA